MISVRLLVTFGCIVAGLFAAGCESDASDKTSRPDLRPVSDSAPYFCDLVPERAFRMVTGLDIALDVRWSGPQKDDGLCLAHAKSRSSPLGVHWSWIGGDKTVGFHYSQWAEATRHPLPAELGKGLAVPTASGPSLRPNYVIGVFSCGKRRPWISIDFASVVRGRDAVRDMVDFMRIAQRRFGVIHKCAPKPS